MSTLQPTAVELSCEPSGAFESLVLAGASKHTATIEPWIPAPQAGLHEPSSLTLILIGVATLAAFRGIQKRITGPSDARRADHGLIKPRRRAA